MTIKVALAGAGAFGIKHLDGIKNIDGVEVVSLISRDLEKTKEVADKYGIGHITTKLEDSLALKEVDAVILCTPRRCTPSRPSPASRRASTCRWRFPLADTLKGAQDAVAAWPSTHRPGGHVRPHPPLQPQPPVCEQADQGRQVQHPADGCADLLFSPHQHERAGPGHAAGPTTCCGTTLRTP